MTTEYKVWIHIELVNDDEDHYEEVTEPRSLYSSSDLEIAKDFMESLVGSDPQLRRNFCPECGWHLTTYNDDGSEEDPVVHLNRLLADDDDPVEDEFGGWS